MERPINVHNLTFNVTGYTITGSTLTLGGITPTITAGASITGTIASDLVGPAGLTKAGTGTVNLAGANSYAGTTTIGAGILQVGNGGTTGTLGTGAVVDNAALRVNRSDAITVDNAISGTGTLTQAGAGTTTLTGANTYAGITTISAGTLQVGNGGTTGSLGTGNVTDNAALVVQSIGRRHVCAASSAAPAR